MSADPSVIQQLLMQKLQQQPPTSIQGGGGGGPQMQSQTSPFNAAATLAQKAMLVNALQNQQQRQATAMVPGTNSQIQADPAMQALQQSPQLNGALLQQMQAPPAAAGPTS